MLRISLICVLIWSSLTTAAPLPFHYKHVDPKSVVGTWNMKWQGGVGLATFCRGGGFTNVWAGKLWIGWWNIQDGKLVVTEALVPAGPLAVPNWYTWSVLLDDDYRGGRLTNGGTFKLERRK